MTYTVSSGALNSTPINQPVFHPVYESSFCTSNAVQETSHNGEHGRRRRECTALHWDGTATDGGAAFGGQMALAAISCQSIRQVAQDAGRCGAPAWTAESMQSCDGDAVSQNKYSSRLARGGSVAEWLACWSQPRRCLRQTVHTNRVSVHQAAKLAAALLRGARVTVGLAESNGSLPPGL